VRTKLFIFLSAYTKCDPDPQAKILRGVLRIPGHKNRVCIAVGRITSWQTSYSLVSYHRVSRHGSLRTTVEAMPVRNWRIAYKYASGRSQSTRSNTFDHRPSSLQLRFNLANKSLISLPRTSIQTNLILRNPKPQPCLPSSPPSPSWL
jgi:hypothetical protein